MNNKPQLVVLAAGMGSRYGGLKQIDPIGPNGEIILDYSIYDAIQGGFGSVVFVIRHDIEKDFREVVGKRWESRFDVHYAFQQIDAIPKGFAVPEGRTKPWGTGHAVLCAREQINGPFSVINADDFYGRSGYLQMGKALSENRDANRFFMVGYPLRNTLSEFGTVSRGICVSDAQGCLQEVTERTKIAGTGNGAAEFTDEDGTVYPLTGDEIASMNFWGFMPSLFNDLTEQFEEFLRLRGTELKSEIYLPAVVARRIKEGKTSVRILKSTDSWFGVTYREDKPCVQASLKKLIADGIYPSALFA